ncbi:hypothetical protein HU200_000801 [Digitaria exilis]|uniref:KIB1-4 beta-propeller domain-containing protein n=1 Tax=Digitaria exilis TaxID=1010633 RepID=A0A835KXX2_9POAL|nr:hypothetical protein HU200_000801 [Digitaria exilis]
MLEEVFQSDAHLFINTATGRRFVRKDLPLLRRYFVVAADGGSIVLVERASPHAACVLNPFTGSLIMGLVPSQEHANRFSYLVESAGEMLIVFKMQNRSIEVFKMDTANYRLVRVKDIGSRALFVGDCRCLSVDAQQFPSVEANSIYYVLDDDEPTFDIICCIGVYNLKDEKEVLAGGAIDAFSPDALSLLASPPFTAVQLLSFYTFEVRGSELWVNMS